MYLASIVAEIGYEGEELVSILDELNRRVEEHAAERQISSRATAKNRGHSPRSARWTKTLGTHVISAFHGNSFLSLAVRLGICPYVRAKAESVVLYAVGDS